MSIGERLKKARNAKKHTQESFAEMLNVSVGTYRNWEQNINAPDGETIAALATALNVTSDYLLGKDDNMTTNQISPKKAYLMDRIAKADDKYLNKVSRMMEFIDDEEINNI